MHASRLEGISLEMVVRALFIHVTCADAEGNLRLGVNAAI